jgi:hypothetical protein
LASLSLPMSAQATVASEPDAIVAVQTSGLNVYWASHDVTAWNSDTLWRDAYSGVGESLLFFGGRCLLIAGLPGVASLSARMAAPSHRAPLTELKP